MPIRSTYMLPCRRILVWACTSIQRPPSTQRISQSQLSPVFHLTCLVLHFHPFLLSCGHLSENVDFLASIIRVFRGYSWLNSPSSFAMVATIAHPHSGACFKCSARGSSPFSHPSREFWQRKQATLSGLACVG